jgi:hypothetical protein
MGTFTKEPETAIQYRSDTTISAQIVEQFPKFSAIVLAFLRSGYLSRGLSPQLFHYWIQFIRSVILNEDLDRHAAFGKILEAVPFLDVSGILHEGWMNLKLIGGLVQFFGLKHPDAGLAASYYSLHTSFVQTLATGHISDLEGKARNFLSIVPKVSVDLYTRIQAIWPAVARLFLHLANLQLLQVLVRSLRLDLGIECPDPLIFGCFFANFTMSICWSMERCGKTGLLQTLHTKLIGRLQEVIGQQLKKPPSLLTSPMDQFLVPFATELEAVRQHWTPSLLADLAAKARPFLLSLMSSLADSRNSSLLPNVGKIEEISELMSIKADDVFIILAQVYSVFRGIQFDSQTQREAANGFKRILDFGISFSLVLTQLACSQLFISKIICEKETPLKLAPSGKSEPITENQIFNLPTLLVELEGLCDDERLVHKVRELTASIRRSISEVLNEHEGGLLVTWQELMHQNQQLLAQLDERREEANQQRIAFLRAQRQMANVFKERNRELEQVKKRVNTRMIELEKVRADVAQRRSWRAELLAEIDRDGPEGSAMVAETARKVHVEEADLSSLNRIVKELIEANAKLREKVKGEMRTQESAGEVAAAEEEEEGMTEEMETAIEVRAFAGLDEFKATDWSSDEAYRRSANALLRAINDLVWLQKMKQERERRIRRRIAAMRQSVVNTRSALMRLLENEI